MDDLNFEEFRKAFEAWDRNASLAYDIVGTVGTERLVQYISEVGVVRERSVEAGTTFRLFGLPHWGTFTDLADLYEAWAYRPAVPREGRPRPLRAPEDLGAVCR